MKKRKLNIKKTITSSLILITIVFALAMLSKLLIGSFKPSVTYYLASSTNEVPLYDEELKEVKKKYRGSKINIFENKFIKKDNKKYMEIKEEGKNLYIDTSNLVKKQPRRCPRKRIICPSIYQPIKRYQWYPYS